MGGARDRADHAPRGGDHGRLARARPRAAFALLLGQGDDGTGYASGEWEEMAPKLDAYFASQRERLWVKPTTARPPRPAPRAAAATPGEPLVDFREITVRYNSHVVFDKLNWLVRAGEKWVVVGGNGTGKSTLVELVTGDNVQGYQNDVHLFGRKKGSGESIWEIKSQLGVLSTEFHMEYIDYADPSVRTPSGARQGDDVGGGVLGLLRLDGAVQRGLARAGAPRQGMDRALRPPRHHHAATAAAAAGGGARTRRRARGRRGGAREEGYQNFFHLSTGSRSWSSSAARWSSRRGSSSSTSRPTGSPASTRSGCSTR